MPIRLALLLTFLLPLLTACGDDEQAEDQPRWSSTVTQLEGVPVDDGTIVWFGPDGVRFAFAREVEGGVALVVDGTPGPTYPSFPVTWGAYGSDSSTEEGGPAIFVARHGTRVAHSAAVEGGVALVVDGKAGPAFDRLMPPNFSPDGGRIAYVAVDGDQHVVMLDGKEHARVAGVATVGPGGWPLLMFSTDGRRFAFVETKGAAGQPTASRAWIDGDAKPWFHEVRWLRFSADGNDVAYVATNEQPKPRQRMVRSDTIGPSFTSIGAPTFSPDSKHLAYYGRRPDGSGLVLDNVPQSEGLTDIIGPPVFCPDGSLIAYVESVEGGWRVVVDGKPQPIYDTVHGLGFQPGGWTVHYMTGQRRQFRMVIGEAAGPATESLWPLQHSPDGQHYAYRMMGADKQTSMVIDGVVTPVGAPWASDPLFSPSGQSIAYGAHGDGQARLVLDGDLGPVFEQISTDGDLAWTHGRFVDDDTFQYLAIRDGSYHLIEAKRNK